MQDCGRDGMTWQLNFGHHNIAIHGITSRMLDNADGSGLMLARLVAFAGFPSLGGPQWSR